MPEPHATASSPLASSRTGVVDVTSPAMRLLDRYLGDAVERGASDLHFEPARDGLRVRVRVDGILHTADPPPASLGDALLTRLRLLARVDLAERRLPQDGRFRFVHDAQDVDVRAAFMPAHGGDKVALRLLRTDARPLRLDDLGFATHDAAAFRRALARPSGLIAAVGPTGSGKTTTLYAALESLRSPRRSIVTVEDPVERGLEGIVQVDVDDECGRDYSAVLRAILRQDPDTIMIGEMRDTDSARVACRAALTGHAVLTTLHTADSREALLRLTDMGVPDYLVAATASLVVAQRLVRRVCSECRTLATLHSDERLLFERNSVTVPSNLARPTGCRACSGDGYRGRTAVFEVLECGPHRPARRVSAPRTTLMQAGLARAAALETTIDEVLAHCPDPLR